MAITSFKPAVWETAIITQFRGISVTELITTAPTEIRGNKAIFNSISGGTVKEYTGTVSYEEATTSEIELVYDKSKYWAIKINDVDKVQAAGDVLTTMAQEKALDIKETIDVDVLTEMAKVPTASNKQLIGTTSAKKEITTPEQAYDFIVDLGIILSKNKVPKSNRFVLASSEFIGLMAKDKRFADNYNVLPNGILEGANINGMTVIECEDVPANTVLCVHKSAFGFGKDLDKTEALRLESSFSDAVRGLVNYGKVALRPKGIAALLYTIA